MTETPVDEGSVWRGLLLERVTLDVVLQIQRELEAIPAEADRTHIRNDKDELLTMRVRAVTIPDAGLIGLRLAQVQTHKDRLADIAHNATERLNYIKKRYEGLFALLLPYVQGLARSEAERKELLKNYLRQELNMMEEARELKELVKMRQDALISSGETLSRQLSAIQLQLTIMEKTGNSVGKLVWTDELEEDLKYQAREHRQDKINRDAEIGPSRGVGNFG